MVFLKIYGWHISEQQLADYATRNDIVDPDPEDPNERPPLGYIVNVLMANIHPLVHVQRGRQVIKTSPDANWTYKRKAVGNVIGLWAEEFEGRHDILKTIKDTFGFEGKPAIFKRYF